MATVEEKYFTHYKRPNGIEYNEDGSKFCTSAQLLSSDIMPGAMHCSAVWYLTPGLHDIGTHTHDVTEVVGFIGTDTENTGSLNGRMRFFIDGEWVEFTESCFITIPAGVEHCPYEFLEVNTPILHISFLPTAKYSGTNTDGEKIDLGIKED